jgi:hypothetical protein
MMTHQTKTRRPRNDDRYEDDYEDNRYDDNQRPRNSRKKRPSALSQIPMDWMLSIGSLGLVYEAASQTSLLSVILIAAWICLCSIVMVYTDKDSASFNSNYRRFLKGYGRTGLLGVAFAVVSLVSLFFVFSEPSYAAFLSDAETKVAAVFSTASTGGSASTQIALLVALVFGLIRLILLLAVIFGVVKAIQNRDDAEQVKAQLMLPIIIICGVVVVDVMTVLIFP